MKLTSLSLIMNKITSSMMRVSLAAGNSTSAPDVVSNNQNFFDTLGYIFEYTLRNLLLQVWGMLVTLVYTIMKYVLTLIDFIFIIIKQMIGLNAEAGNLREATSEDLIFKFVFNENVIRVIRDLIGFAIVLIILFTIIAIIKTEYRYATGLGDGNSKSDVARNTFKSLFLMVMIPLMFIGGVVMSNAILSAVYSATAGGSNTSLSNQIFISAGYNANAYRRYADRDLKIPMTLNFEDVGPFENVATHPMDGTVSEMDKAFKAFRSNSVWERGFSSFVMFYTEAFPSMGVVDALVAAYDGQEENSYNESFDMGIRTKKQEYYVMADVIDYALKENRTIKFASAEEIYNSYNATVRNISPSNNIPALPIEYNANTRTYDFTISFEGEQEPTKYSHKAGATSESDGAVYMIAEEVTVENQTFLYPVLSARNNFMTDQYAIPAQPVVARGLFEDGEFPTAIRESPDGTILFYRDHLNVPTLLDFFPKISYEAPPEGYTQDFVNWIIRGFTGITSQLITGVDISDWIPYIYYSFDIWNLYTKQTYNVLKLDHGLLHIDYMFNMKGMSVDNFYNMADFNVVVLVFAAVLITGILIRVMLGLARRVLDITMLAISYPAVVSTIPLDNGQRLSNWTKTIVDNLLSIYGTAVGINIILLLIPQIDKINIFTPAMLQSGLGIGFLSFKYTAWLCNSIIHLLFILVAFASMKDFGQIISGLLISDVKNNDIYNMGVAELNDLKKVPEKAANFVSGKWIKDSIEKVGELAGSAIPGMAFVQDAKRKVEDKTKLANLNKNAKEGMKGMFDAVKNAKKGVMPVTSSSESAPQLSSSEMAAAASAVAGGAGGGEMAEMAGAGAEAAGAGAEMAGAGADVAGAGAEAAGAGAEAAGEAATTTTALEDQNAYDYIDKQDRYAREQTELHYADYDRAGYQQYIADNRLEDNNDSRRSFYNQERSKAQAAYDENLARPSAESRKIYQDFNEKEGLAENAARKANMYADSYTTADTEGYSKYLQDNGATDSIDTRVSYYNDRVQNEDKNKFNNMADTGRFLKGRGRHYSENENFVNEFTKNNGDYQRYLQESGRQDSKEARAYYFVSTRNSVNQQMNVEYQKFIRDKGLADNAESGRRFEQEKRKYLNGGGDQSTSLAAAVRRDQEFNERRVSSQIRADSVPGSRFEMSKADAYSRYHKEDYDKYRADHGLDDTLDSQIKFYSNEIVTQETGDFVRKYDEAIPPVTTDGG